MTKKQATADCDRIVLTKDNAENIKRLIACHKNILVCGIKGVGKIIFSLAALKDAPVVHYLGNPFDFEGRRRPGSYDKYLRDIISLRPDLRIVQDIDRLLKTEEEIVLIIDEIYGRSERQLGQIEKLLEVGHIRIIQVVGCMKNMGPLIGKVDIILVLEQEGAFTVDREFGMAVCEILRKRTAPKAEGSAHGKTSRQQRPPR